MLNFTLKGLIITLLWWTGLDSQAQTALEPCTDLKTRAALLALYQATQG